MSKEEAYNRIRQRKAIPFRNITTQFKDKNVKIKLPTHTPSVLQEI
jgi:hypothetical protein